MIRIKKVVISSVLKGLKAKAGIRDVLLLPPALKAQKSYTFLQDARIFYNPYQNRYTSASMMLSQGKNIMWVSRQLGRVGIEIVMKTYGR